MTDGRSTTSSDPGRRRLLQGFGGVPLLALAGTLSGARVMAGAERTTSLPARAQPVPLGYFGLHMHEPATPWPQLPFGRLRLWDTRTSWMHLQPARDRWDFSRLDRFIALAQQANVAPVLPLGLTPTWASARPDERSPYNVPGAAAEPADLADWRLYVRTVVQRYRGRIAHYEIWNEVNAGAGFYTGSPERLLDLQRAAYEELKAVDPAITVIAPSVEGVTEDKFRWFERYMALMRGRWADVLAYHFYHPRLPPEVLPDAVRRVRAIADRHGAAQLPLWNTESGYRIDWGGTEPVTGTMGTWPNLAPAKAGAWLARCYLLGWLTGLDGYFWYSYDNRIMGMTPRARGDSPVVQALAATVARLRGRLVGAWQVDGNVASVLVAGSSSPTRWVWTTDDEPRDWRLPAEWGARAAVTLPGASVPVDQGRVALSGMPVIVAASRDALAL